MFVEVRRPTNLEKLIGCRYVFKTKMKNGRVDKYKARMVAKGYSQVRERDFNETFAPVARMDSLRIFLKLSVIKGHVRRSIDFTAVFLASSGASRRSLSRNAGRYDMSRRTFLKTVEFDIRTQASGKILVHTL